MITVRPLLPALRRVPDCGVSTIKRFEGLHDGDKRTPIILEPQADPVGIYSVGWGYALFLNGKPVRDRETAYRLWRQRWPHGMTIADAEVQLRDTAQDVCNRVVALVPGVKLNDNELGALVSLSYNIGVGQEGGVPDFADSTVRRKLKAGDRQGAADAFLLWKFAGGRELPGLVARRKAERTLFLSPA